jgi:NAD(P)-dependent dehydrogenase (short-subunit alcohol dehydrogenase family)
MMAKKNQNKYKNPFTATLTGIREIFRKQKPDCFLHPEDRLDGKTVLIDGASSGLGFAVAVEIARRGAKVIMACRSGIPDKGELVKTLSGNNDVHMLPVDFADISSIQNLVSSIQNQYAPIDILICNAAIVPKESRKTMQGLEEMFMVNYLSKFLFINLLIEHNCFTILNNDSSLSAIRRSPFANQSEQRKTEIEQQTANSEQRIAGLPRIIIISSESHRNPTKIDWEGFGRYREYGIKKTVELYGYYKLLLTTFARELSGRLNPGGETNYSVFSLCPGPINSRIAREAPGLFQPLLKLVFHIFFKSPEKAAIPVIYFAASKEIEGKPFDYLFLMNRKEIDEKAKDPGNGKKLWEVSDNLRKQLSLNNET